MSILERTGRSYGACRAVMRAHRMSVVPHNRSLDGNKIFSQDGHLHLASIIFFILPVVPVRISTASLVALTTSAVRYE